jgi:hypothetical protein
MDDTGDNTAASNTLKVEEMDTDDDLDGRLNIANAAENGEDEDDDDESFTMEEDEAEENLTDDELEVDDSYDEDLDDVDTDGDIQLKPRGYTPNPPRETTLGEDSKSLLIWREGSWSDWTINVAVEREDGSEETTCYNVHRSALATGPKKSIYFKALFQANDSSEVDGSMTKVSLPEKVAAQFPEFLDYLYSQPSESWTIVDFANWRSMKYLAEFFDVPRLVKDVRRFVESDMYNLDHMKDYLSGLDFYIREDLSNRLYLKTIRVCAEMILSIDAESSLLKSIPPPIFAEIISTLGQSNSFTSAPEEDRKHVWGLLPAYREQILDSFIIDTRALKPIVLDDVELAGQWAIALLGLMRRLKEEEGVPYDWLCIVCTATLRKYLLSKVPSFDLMEDIMQTVPERAAAALSRELFLRRAPLTNGDILLRCNVTLGLLYGDGEFGLGEREVPVSSTDNCTKLKLKVTEALGFPLHESHHHELTITHNGVEILNDSSDTISDCGLTSENNLIKVVWKW